MKRILIIVVCLLFVENWGYAQLKHAKDTKYPSYKGLIMAGYQGWFRAPGDGTNQGFGQYGKGRVFDENNCTIDIWPDVTEYAKTYETPFSFADGSKAKVFSSVDESTTDLHFKWMQEYGIDGVFMQRFFGSAKNHNEKAPQNVILKNALSKASKYERAIAVMYDLSGLAASGEDCSAIIDDWKWLVDKLKVTNQDGVKTYLHHNGKPVVAIWGVGFPDRPYNIRNIGLEHLIDFLHNDPVYGGCAVMLGVPTFWRNLEADCVPDPYLHTLIKQADLLLPWTIQRFSPLLHNDMARYRDLIIEDMKWCRENHVDYVSAVTPGFSWHNLSTFEFPDDVKPVGSIPRMGGKFYWQQLSTAIQVGSGMIYVAMFDEIDEGTAIFKCSDKHPINNVAKFIDMDGMPSDHYLWLTGEAARMLRGEKKLELKLPVRK
ncbi:glycoside hydrolase family 71/99-like protein [uncultured Bacteroides sp.]|uniref:glycoside hydrolase family 71/99-like protein n=1 Tax=uncultured Bacteroides sp. TaxID=162156 RepID=UPI002AA5E31D|nr:glycoside hydrolase family 71/99-like protein [uncultured Bacteroides sp.]